MAQTLPKPGSISSLSRPRKLVDRTLRGMVLEAEAGADVVAFGIGVVVATAAIVAVAAGPVVAVGGAAPPAQLTSSPAVNAVAAAHFHPGRWP
jgi:hypothetical protein